MHEPVSGPPQARGIQVQALAQAWIAVETQTLGIGHRHQEQVQRQCRVVALLDVVVAYQAVVNPAELWGEAPGSGGAYELFVGHAFCHPH